MRRASRGIEPLELVANLSLGQRQIVEIVKTISRQPTMLFMDEPTSALAEREVEWLFGRDQRSAPARRLHRLHLPSLERSQRASPIGSRSTAMAKPSVPTTPPR